MGNVEEKKYKLERLKILLLFIGAVSTFLTFSIPFVYQREQQMNLYFSEALQRLGDANPAVRATSAIDLISLHRYRRYFGIGPKPFEKRCMFVLINSLIKEDEKEFVRQSIIQAIIDMDSQALEGARLKKANLNGLDLKGVSFANADLSFANLSQSTAIDLGTDDYSANFEYAVFLCADMKDTEFMYANFEGALLERTDLSSSRLWHGTNLSKCLLVETDLTNANLSGPDQQGANLEDATIDGAILTNTDLSHTFLNGATFKNISKWDDKTNFKNAACENTTFDTSSDFYKWGQRKFPNCFN
ncbi:MAG: hypothetical protein GQ559_11070 [Desulfobulbaceae bacterium]|nr:hypothetical protein [Desulfobulbaceae bacterium]